MSTIRTFIFFLAALALSMGEQAHGDSRWNTYLNYEFQFILKYPAYINRIEEHGPKRNDWPVDPFCEWGVQQKLLQIFFSYGDSLANRTSSPMWLSVYSNPGHADLESSADSVMRPYTMPGLYIHLDTCSVAGKNAILAETWDGYMGERKTDLLETYIFQHRDVVITLTFPRYDYVSGRGDTLWLAEDRKYVLRSISLF